MKITQKFLIVKYLYTMGVGNWVPSYNITKYASGSDYIIADADTRCYEILRDGGQFETDNAIYTIEHRRVGKFAEFRISKKEKKHPSFPGMRRLSTV